MKSSEEIVSYLESALEEANKGYEHWKNIDRSEAGKYRVQANQLERILENIDPIEEQHKPEEQPKLEENTAKVLVFAPETKNPRKRFLQIYLKFYFFLVFFASCIAVSSFIYDLAEKFKIIDVFSPILFYVYLMLHIGSFLLMLIHHDLLFTSEK